MTRVSIEACGDIKVRIGIKTRIDMIVVSDMIRAEHGEREISIHYNRYRLDTNSQITKVYTNIIKQDRNSTNTHAIPSACPQ